MLDHLLYLLWNYGNINPKGQFKDIFSASREHLNSSLHCHAIYLALCVPSIWI